MDRPVELVEKLEDKPLRAQASGGEDHFLLTFDDELFQQLRDVGGSIEPDGERAALFS
jgi:hypothetical protein